LGRVDFQIKLRGYRIEAGEVEAALMQHPAVQTAIVKVLGDSQQARLVAYIVSGRSDLPTIEELSDSLGRKLPDYMVPSSYMFLDALPLSVNGKVDRQALPTQLDLFRSREVVYSAPQNEIERSIASIFQEVLEIEEIGVTNNFFDLGANSLLITTVYRKLAEVLPAQIASISLVDLFNYPTVRALAQRLMQAKDVNSLGQQSVEDRQKLSQGKDRLKQRLERSKLASK
jgi:pyochelin synthetase